MLPAVVPLVLLPEVVPLVEVPLVEVPEVLPLVLPEVLPVVVPEVLPLVLPLVLPPADSLAVQALRLKPRATTARATTRVENRFCFFIGRERKRVKTNG